jgi:1-acyl-sn-glycerol-3-phosphate acyltransferase
MPEPTEPSTTAPTPDEPTEPSATPAAPSSNGAEGGKLSGREERFRARLAAPVHPPTAFERTLYWFIRGALVALSRLWFRLEIVGRDKIPANGPFILAPVHRSNIDFFLVAALTKTRMRYMGKDSLWKSALLGRFIDALGAFPVRRGSADREALRICMQVIENGEPLVMFPEGTRREGDLVDEVFDGPAYVAARSGVPLVPVGIGGSDHAMPKGAKFIKPRKIVLVVGDPIAPARSDGSGRVPRRAVRELTAQLKPALQSLYDDARARTS